MIFEEWIETKDSKSSNGHELRNYGLVRILKLGLMGRIGELVRMFEKKMFSPTKRVE